MKSLHYNRFYVFQNPAPDLLLCLSSKVQQKAKRRGVKAGKLLFHGHALIFTWLEIFPPEKLAWRSVAPRKAPELEQDQAINHDPAVGRLWRQIRDSHRSLPCRSAPCPPQHGADVQLGRGLTQARAEPAPTTTERCTCTCCCDTDFQQHTSKYPPKNTRPVSEHLSTSLAKHYKSR